MFDSTISISAHKEHAIKSASYKRVVAIRGTNRVLDFVIK